MKFARLLVSVSSRCLPAARRGGANRSPARSRGTVQDSSGGVLPGVTVTVTNVNTEHRRTDVTNERRRLTSFPSLPIGTYTVAAELQGFRKAEKTGFELTADGRITADFALASAR